jgi:adenylate cyclase
MSQDSFNRKLTAILYADVVGYSRLTGSDEEGTHRRVMQVLDYVSGMINEAGGTVLRYAGDAILAEFSSTVTAAKTAAIIQVELASRNESFGVNEKVQIRIGINIGDVIEDRGEVFGDGVNLAARLEAAAPEGGICISASVHEQVQGKVDAIYSDDGAEEFKNIDHLVHVYRWYPALSVKQDQDVEMQQNKSDMPSIAVLALKNMNGDSEYDFLGDGITEDLITALSKSDRSR